MSESPLSQDEIEQLLDAIAAGYGIIIFPASGKFKINGPINISSKLIILGCGAEIYADPVKASDRNIFVFGYGADNSKIYSLNLKFITYRTIIITIVLQYIYIRFIFIDSFLFKFIFTFFFLKI